MNAQLCHSSLGRRGLEALPRSRSAFVAVHASAPKRHMACPNTSLRRLPIRDTRRAKYFHVPTRAEADSERAGVSGQDSAGTPTPEAAATRSPVPPSSPPRIKLVSVEKSTTPLQGVANVDDGSETVDDAFKRNAVLAFGDVAMLVVFSAIGRASHSEGVFTPELFLTALPFVLGWAFTSPFTGAYERSDNLTSALLTPSKSWAVAVPIGLLLRGISKGRVPPTPFIIVSMVATLVLLLGWRALAFTKVLPSVEASASKKRRANRRGGPLEFLSLLKGLTTRW